MNKPVTQTARRADFRSDQEVEAELFEVPANHGLLTLNWHFVGGCTLIVFGLLYILTSLGLLAGTALATMAIVFPWLAVLIMVAAITSAFVPKRRTGFKRTKADTRASSAGQRSQLSQLTKARHHRILAGVCRGLSRWSGCKVWPVRLAFVAFTAIPFFRGAGLFLYILLALVLPRESSYPKEPTIAVIHGK